MPLVESSYLRLCCQSSPLKLWLTISCSHFAVIRISPTSLAFSTISDLGSNSLVSKESSNLDFYMGKSARDVSKLSLLTVTMGRKIICYIMFSRNGQ